MLDIARLILALFCLAISLTALIKAPNLLTWMLSLGATEYGHWFALAALAVAVPFGLQPMSLVATGLGLVAAGVFLSTLGRAFPFGAQLHGRLQAAFGEVPSLGQPFSWKKLFFGTAGERRPSETLIYSQGGDYSLRMNFFRSVRPDPSPCVIVLHTGGWNSGTPDEFFAFNSHLANRGYAVAALQYRLSPTWTWPAQLEDVKQALSFLKQRRAELGVDPTKFVLLGRSAGGHIAETAAYSLTEHEIRGCIAFYAPADMHYAYRFGREDDMLKSLQVVRDFLGGSPAERPDQYDSASAIRFVHSSTPPTLLFHGTPDPLVWHLQSRRLNDELAKAGVPHLLIEPPWATHAFDYNFNGPGGQLSTYAVDYFLSSVTR